MVECHAEARRLRLVKTDPSEIWEHIKPLTDEWFDLIEEANDWGPTVAIDKKYTAALKGVVEWDE